MESTSGTQQAAAMRFSEIDVVDRIIRGAIEQSVAYYKALDRAIDGKTIEAFTYAGFAPSSYVDEGLVSRVLGAHLAGYSRRYIQKMVLEHYDADNCRAVAAIVARLKKNELFQGRKSVLSEALRAHRQKRFDAITTYALLPMIEGIVMPLVGKVLPRWEGKKGNKPGHGRIPRVLHYLFELAEDWKDVRGTQSVLDYLEQHLYKNFGSKEPVVVPGKYCDLHRHALLHGHELQGTRLNSLRCFLILDQLAIFVPYAYEEFERYEAKVRKEEQQTSSVV